MKPEQLLEDSAKKLYSISQLPHMGCGEQEYALYVLSTKDCKQTANIQKEYRIIHEVIEQMISLLKEKFSYAYIDKWIHNNIMLSMRKKENNNYTKIKEKLFELKLKHDNWQKESAFIVPISGISVQEGKQEKIANILFWNSIDFFRHAKNKNYNQKPREGYTTYAEFRYVAEIDKTRELAKDKILKVLEILQTFNFGRNYHQDVPEITIGGYEQNNRQENFSEINEKIYLGLNTTKKTTYLSLPFLKDDNIDILEKTFEILDAKSPKEISASILKGIHWHSLGEQVTQQEIALVYFVMSLEVLLGKKVDGVGIQNTIAESLAFILYQGLDKRKRIVKTFKDIYKKRCSISHGFKNVKEVSITDIENVRYFSLEILKFLIKNVDTIKTKDDLKDYIDNLKFSTKEEK